MTLRGQTALVTGGARGIGQGIAVELARAGADVAFLDICDEPQAEETLAQIAGLGRTGWFFRADVSDRGAVERAYEELIAKSGGLDILVNNAAANVRKSVLEISVAEVERVWGVALWGVFHCSQLAARQMTAQGRGGNIVVISSIHAERPYMNNTPYNAAKAAVNHMAKTWAGELAAHRIRVNVVEPGWTDTPGERTWFTDEFLYDQGTRIPLGRLGKPEDIGNAVRWLVSPDAGYVTGSILLVDGGMVLPR